MQCECSENVRIGVVNLTEDAPNMPERATNEAACYDIRANFWENEITGWDAKNIKCQFPVFGKALEFHPGDRMLIPTGIALLIPRGYCVKVYPRSGLSTKQGLTLVNNTGIIDADYTGELLIPLINVSNQFTQVLNHEKVAQIKVEKLIPTVFYEQETASSLMNHAEKSNRRFGNAGGFGSTGL